MTIRPYGFGKFNTIRPYGPGKFKTILDSYVYSVSLNGGCDDEIGDSSETSWYGRMNHGNTIFLDHDPFQEPLNDEERELLTGSEGVIIREDSDGFVAISYFADKAKLDATWAEIVAEFESNETETE
jgi:hypothetical protein